MLKNYFTIAFRNLLKNKVYSFINITGLAVGMFVAMLIGLWIHDELAHDKQHRNYDRLGRVMVSHDFNGQIATQWSQPFPLGEELRRKFRDDIEHVSMTSWSYGHFLQHGDVRISREGMFAEPEFVQMFSLKMIRGTKDALTEPHSIIINQSLAKTIFSNTDPLGKIIKIDNQSIVKVTGVYEDLPNNSSFNTVQFLLPWKLYGLENEWVKNSSQNWGNYSFGTLVQLKRSADFEAFSAKIKDLIIKNNPRTESKPALLLHPMSKWHLYAEFENGVNTGGGIQFVWLFGIIGVFVLFLACINFMNLSTARSEKRAKEVGVRKAVGSLRRQLIFQFLGESLLFVVLAFSLSLLLTQLLLNWFNNLAQKNMNLLFAEPFFWLASFVFILLTSLLSGSYPALFLSSFKPISILKGNFRSSRFSGRPRKILVVVQFTISLALTIGTIIVYRQILHAKDRPIGYDRNNLVTTYGYPFSDRSNDPKKYDYLKDELIKTRAVISMAKSSSPTTDVYSNQSDFDWEGRDPNLMPNFGVVWCTHDYGKTIGLQFIEGRDFSRQYPTDTAAIILNEAAVKFMQLRNPINKLIEYNRANKLRVIGVVSDLLMESPYATVRPTVFMVDYNQAQIIALKLNPSLSASQALSKIEPVFKSFNPESLFEVQFVDEEFNRKFINEERIGKLASFFAALAILISCLGLFGLSSFVAEQRAKEIGIRKILGASVFNMWKMLSKDFVLLILVSSFIAIPLAWYGLHQWLEKYEYRTEISWWIFASAGAGVLVITLLTVSFQAIKAAMMNPVKSIRSE